MEQYIDKAAVVAEIKEKLNTIKLYVNQGFTSSYEDGKIEAYLQLMDFLNTLEVKEVDEQKERMNKCPYRQVGCTMYKDKILNVKVLVVGLLTIRN